MRMQRRDNVIYLHQLNPAAALERLNRVTGLQFARWPQSLRPALDAQQALSVEAVTVERGVVTDDIACNGALGLHLLHQART